MQMAITSELNRSAGHSILICSKDKASFPMICFLLYAKVLLIKSLMNQIAMNSEHKL